MVETLNANVPLEKSKIISVLKQKGPSVANTIAKTLELNNILACAILSEMTADKTLKASHLKIGGSPLYYIPGQEMVLENFTSYLEPKEREAFAKLKAGGILMDSELEPAIRVALRNIKDFAIPLKVNISSQDRLIWKYFMLKKEDAESKIEELFSAIKKSEQKEKISEPAKKLEEKKEKIEEKRPEKKEEKKKEKRRTKENFSVKWLEISKAEIKEQITMKSKEQASIISVPSELGKLNFILIAKSKKLTEADLAMAYQESLERKMPAIILTKKRAPKNIEEYANSFGGYLLLKAVETFKNANNNSIE
jgi:hypothetical protein